MSAPTHYRLPGMAVTERTFTVPLDHAHPAGPTTSIFTVELVDLRRVGDDLPWLLFLQGGPGGASPRPQHGGEAWFGRALQTHRVLLLDQRGTGRSAPLTWRQALRHRSAEELAHHITLLRADSIVRDAELIRERLSPGRPWEVLGQSYGGRVVMTYLALAPEGLAAAYVTGGLPSLDASALDVNRLTARQVRDRLHAFHDRFPWTSETVQRLRETFTTPLQLPGGERIGLDRVRQLGRLVGMTDGPARLQWLLANAFTPDGDVHDLFVDAVLEITGYARNPLHPVLIDLVKIDPDRPVGWPGSRALAELPEFAEDADEMLLNGELSLPWMFDEIPALRPFRDAVHILEEETTLPPLWDRKALRDNTVPVAAAVYHEDMYVAAEHSLATAHQVPHLRHWITNEWQHDGLTRSGGRVLDHLMRLATQA